MSARRRARKAARHRRTREEIVDAAREVVLRDGFDKLTIGAIADDLGLTKPALYYYFSSKEALQFEVVLQEWAACAHEIEAAVEAVETGAEALEALMRTFFDRYRERTEMFMFSHRLPAAPDLVGPEELARIRPLNDMYYGGVEARLRAEQRRGRFPKRRNPRLFAFTAHMAVVGLLNTKAMVESVGDPLIHGDDELIDDVVRTFRAAAEGGAK